MTAYAHKAWRIRAVQWTGSNRAEVEQFFADHFPEGCGLRFSIDEYPDSYNMVQFGAWGDDQEVDPGYWVVVHRAEPEHDGEILSDADFREAYEAVAS